MFKLKKLVTALVILFVMASNAYSMTYEEAHVLAKEGKSSKAISFEELANLIEAGQKRKKEEKSNSNRRLNEPKILGVWCAVEKSSKYSCAGEFDFKNNHLLIQRKLYKYWHISKYKRIFSRETYRVEFSLGKSMEVRVNLNDGKDGVIFISECDTNLRKCLTDYYVRKSVIRDEKRLGYLIGKYEDVL